MGGLFQDMANEKVKKLKISKNLSYEDQKMSSNKVERISSCSTKCKHFVNNGIPRLRIPQKMSDIKWGDKFSRCTLTTEHRGSRGKSRSAELPSQPPWPPQGASDKLCAFGRSSITALLRRPWHWHGDNDTSVKNGPVRIRDMVVMGWKLIPTTPYMMPRYRGKGSRYLCWEVTPDLPCKKSTG